MKKWIFTVMMFLAVFVSSVALALPVGTATLTWDPPTTNTDSTQLTDLAGYKLYYGTASGNYTINVNIPCGILPCPGFASDPPSDLERQQKISSHPTVIAISGLEDNRSWYFAATALDTSVNESGFSNEVSKFIPSSVTDTDGDGMTDVWETANGLNPNNAADAVQDADGDGLTNFQEFGYNTDPRKIDTDGDGMTDAWEITYGLNPNNATDAGQDVDGDRLTNLQEFLSRTNPSQSNAPQIRKIKADFNGDGNGDTLMIESRPYGSTVRNSFWVALSDKTKFVPNGYWLDWGVRDGRYQFLVGDFDGNGASDIAMVEDKVGNLQYNAAYKNTVWVALSDKTKFVPNGYWLDWGVRDGRYQF